ncbi:MAG: cation:proton antiporter [Acidobacteriota bacterium]
MMADGDDAPLGGTGRTKTFLFYGGMVAVAVVLFVFIRSVGTGLVAPDAGGATPTGVPGQSINTLFHALLALAVVVVTARVVGAVFRLIGQPAVIGEVIGGIMLGPSLLGRVAPELFTQLLPANVTVFLSIHAQLGVILYLFLVGLDLDLGRVIRKSGHTTLAISHASIIVPFLLGSGLALVIYPIMSTSDVPFTVFALFLGVSMSVTAFPVLARILTDQAISRSQMGALALTCAAIDDVTAWCLLALVVSIAQTRAWDAMRTVALTIAFVVIVLQVAAPIVRRLIPRIDRSEDLTSTGLSIVLIAMLASSMTTEYIGIHGFFGAFLFGAIIPHDSRIAVELNRRLNDFVAVLFLPAFFAYTGLRTQIGLLSGLDNWLWCGAIILVACLGKFGGTLVASRLSGLKWRDSAALGILMNTRGLVELIVLNMGLDLGLTSPKLFTMLVIMALVTTFMTTPVLQLILRRHPWVEPVKSPEPLVRGIRLQPD